jgi:hypothetical protein
MSFYPSLLTQNNRVPRPPIFLCLEDWMHTVLSLAQRYAELRGELALQSSRSKGTAAV